MGVQGRNEMLGGACRGVHEANHELMGVCREWRMAAAVVGSARVYDGRGGGEEDLSRWVRQTRRGAREDVLQGP